MRTLLVAAPTAVALIGLLAPSAAAQADPVVLIAPDSGRDLCVVPALDALEPRCPLPRSPGRTPDTACNLPVIYLGGRPGPCPERREPPESRIVPLLPADITR